MVTRAGSTSVAGAVSRCGDQIVGVMHVVELGSLQQLRFGVEDAFEVGITEVQVIEVGEIQFIEFIETVQRDDFGDVVTAMMQPAIAGCASRSCGGRAGE